MNRFPTAALALALITTAAPAAIAGPQSPDVDGKEHVLMLHERLLCPDDGLLLGNGDLSVSVYQTADRIVWRFGKGDVWDRRLDLSDDPKPAHIKEIAHGIEVEGWKCPPYGGGPVVATRGTSNPQRMKELCQGTPPSYTKRPFPCPKPVGELVLQLPPDQMGMKIEQSLSIERATLEIVCKWESGVRLDVSCFVAPRPNALVLRWKLTNWNETTRTGQPDTPPVWFSLFRWPDPSLETFGRNFFADFRHGAFQMPSHPNVRPLPPPRVRAAGGKHAIEQTFPPDPLFPSGFKYLMVPLATRCSLQAVEPGVTGEARLQILPDTSARAGCLLVAVPTSSDPGGCNAEWARLRQLVGERIEETATAWATENRNSAQTFWVRSRVRVAEPLLENLWYETLHARRCTYRHDTVPPGLFLPSTVRDYSHWHGDYHLNYNLQEPFWGDYTANQIDLGDAYFQAMTYLLQIGRKIARDYYGARGVFIQLSGFPVQATDDYLGAVPMGRMAYMTGWAMNQYWWRYLYTLDSDWLRQTGYPVIRDCALFYTDFLRKGPDGLYHAFPSNQGEDGFSGNVRDFTDRRQVMQHARY
ncbi:MAG: glycosyl hydrolase family 95 catalytic domain-containing protein, partial [Isosphaeraceae bacterium]